MRSLITAETSTRKGRAARGRPSAGVVARLAGTLLAAGTLILMLSQPAGAASPWKIVDGPSPGTSTSANSVSCPSAASCTAVGTGDALTIGFVAQRTTGGWTSRSVHLPGYADQLNGVSCSGPSTCMAVGGTDSIDISDALAELETGGTWHQVATANPGNPTTLEAVSCPSATLCYAVGDYQSSSGFGGGVVVEKWSGGSFSRVSSVSPSGTDDLTGISCPSTTFCVAVGYRETPAGGSQSLVEKLSGGSFVKVKSANPGQSQYLVSVSCVKGTTSCWTVGRQYDNSILNTHSLVETLRAGAFVTVPSYNTVGDTELYGVSCPTTSSCTAVGTFTTNGTTTIVEDQHGSSFVYQATPEPDNGVLGAVSCTSASACDAVGSQTVRSLEAALYERS